MPCAACTYMPNASWRRRGGKAQGEGYLPPGAKRRASVAKVCTSEARKTVGKPLALRQGRALSKGLVSLCVRVSAHDLQEGRCGEGTAPLRWVTEDAMRLETGEEELLPRIRRKL